MAVQKVKTTDSKGNTYEKFRHTEFGNSVVCLDGTNTHYRGQPNISIRSGPSTYGTEVVFQIDVSEVVSTYSANSGFGRHVEIYFSEEQAIEILIPLLKRLTGEKAEEKKRWFKNVCDNCGTGHLKCEDCQKYTWNEKEVKNGDKQSK